jgi:hypothetical protein
MRRHRQAINRPHNQQARGRDKPGPSRHSSRVRFGVSSSARGDVVTVTEAEWLMRPCLSRADGTTLPGWTLHARMPDPPHSPSPVGHGKRVGAQAVPPAGRVYIVPSGIGQQVRPTDTYDKIQITYVPAGFAGGQPCAQPTQNTIHNKTQSSTQALHAEDADDAQLKTPPPRMLHRAARSLSSFALAQPYVPPIPIIHTTTTTTTTPTRSPSTPGAHPSVLTSCGSP